MKKNEIIHAEIIEKLPRIVHEAWLKEKVQTIADKYEWTHGEVTRIVNKAWEIGLEWSRPPRLKMVSYYQDRDFLDLISGLSRDHYVSYYSALYWNGLSEQRPTTYYLSHEIKGRKPIHSEISPDRVKNVFMKSPRHTNYGTQYKGIKLFILEKTDLSKVGVVKIEATSSNRVHQFLVTNTERTLLDSVISPHYSGGILNVVDAFNKANINIRDLYEYYQIYAPIYPYWQSIGLLLSKTKGNDWGAEWANMFASPPKIDFYLDRQFKSDWEYSSDWKIYYPKGLF